METFEHLLYQLHLSYLQARKNKRNTHNQLRFEMYQEEGIMLLAKAIYERSYTPPENPPPWLSSSAVISPPVPDFPNHVRLTAFSQVLVRYNEPFLYNQAAWII